MHFIVSSSQLLRHLSSLSGVLNNSNTLPILDNFLFELGPGEAIISASDLETTMTTKLEVKTEDTGSIAIPAKMLLDILKAFSDIPLTIKVDPSTFAVELTSDAGKYKLTGANGDEFPKSPALDDSSGMTIDANALLTALNRTLFAAGNDDLRPVMSGIFFEFYSDNVRFVATDAHRLVRYARNDVQASSNAQFIVPKKPLNLLKNAASHAEKVNMVYTDSNVRFEFDNVTIICRLIEGKYPNYEAVIPKENPNRMVINRQDFLQAIRRVSIFANKTTHQVRLKLAGSELVVSAEDLDFANEASERLSCSYAGEDMEIGFNSRFLMDMLNNLSSTEVSLEMSAPNRAGIIKPTESEDEGEEVLMLVMPVMLNA
ncbi:MAG: DNA polymerase III subunit beta [Flavobacteriales bacterium]